MSQQHGTAKRKQQATAGKTWSTGASSSSSLSMSASSKTSGAHIHNAIEVAQLKEWARVVPVEEWAHTTREPQEVGEWRRRATS